MAQMVKKISPAMQETQVLSLGWDDPLEKGMAAHSSILAWRIPGTEEPDGLQSLGHRVRHDRVTNTHALCPIKNKPKVSGRRICYYGGRVRSADVGLWLFSYPV